MYIPQVRLLAAPRAILAPHVPSGIPSAGLRGLTLLLPRLPEPVNQLENHLAGPPAAALSGGRVKVSLPNHFNRQDAIMTYSSSDIHSNNSVLTY